MHDKTFGAEASLVKASSSSRGLEARLSGLPDSAQSFEDYLSQQGNDSLSAILLAFKVFLH